MRHRMTKLVVVLAALLACTPAFATADLSPRLARPVTSLAARSEIHSVREVGRLQGDARTASTGRAWLAILIGFGLLGTLGRRSSASPLEEQQSI